MVAAAWGRQKRPDHCKVHYGNENAEATYDVVSPTSNTSSRNMDEDFLRGVNKATAILRKTV